MKPLSDRAEREAAYDSRKSEMGKWVAPVQANRKAETLDFTPMVSEASRRPSGTSNYYYWLDSFLFLFFSVFLY